MNSCRLMSAPGRHGVSSRHDDLIPKWPGGSSNPYMNMLHQAGIILLNSEVVVVKIGGVLKIRPLTTKPNKLVTSHRSKV